MTEQEKERMIEYLRKMKIESKLHHGIIHDNVIDKIIRYIESIEMEGNE